MRSLSPSALVLSSLTVTATWRLGPPPVMMVTPPSRQSLGLYDTTLRDGAQAEGRALASRVGAAWYVSVLGRRRRLAWQHAIDCCNHLHLFAHEPPRGPPPALFAPASLAVQSTGVRFSVDDKLTLATAFADFGIEWIEVRAALHARYLSRIVPFIAVWNPNRGSVSSRLCHLLDRLVGLELIQQMTISSPPRRRGSRPRRCAGSSLSAVPSSTA